jgi:hypothetical protein
MDLQLPKELKTFEVSYSIQYIGAASGEMTWTGKILRKADTIQTAMQEVWKFLNKNPMLVPVYNVHYDAIELETPAFPPGLAGRTLNIIEVSAKEISTKRLREGYAEEVESLPTDEG